MNEMADDGRARALAAFGADFTRWPEHQVDPARAALLADPDFRRAWEAERDIDAGLGAHRDSLDLYIGQSGAADRVQRRVLALAASAARGAFTGLRWRQVAAAMLVSGMLGGAMDLVLADPAIEGSEAAAPDPLFSLDDPALR